MFARATQTILSVVLFFVVFAAAAPQAVNSCNTGPVQCCNSVERVRPSLSQPSGSHYPYH